MRSIERHDHRLALLLIGIAMLPGGALLAGCNTIAGAGEDIEAAGETLEDTAEDTEEEL